MIILNGLCIKKYAGYLYNPTRNGDNEERMLLQPPPLRHFRQTINTVTSIGTSAFHYCTSLENNMGGNM